MQSILQKYNVKGTIEGDVIIMHPVGKPVKYLTLIETIFNELIGKYPTLVIKVEPKAVLRKYMLSKDGWFYFPFSGRLKKTQKKTIAVTIYKLLQKGKVI